MEGKFYQDPKYNLSGIRTYIIYLIYIDHGELEEKELEEEEVKFEQDAIYHPRPCFYNHPSSSKEDIIIQLSFLHSD